MMTTTEPEALLELAIRAARAGAQAISSSAVELLGDKSSPTDPVTAADHAADAAIRGFLRRRCPDDGQLSEEAGMAAGAQDQGRRRWVVDALDGTVNYLYGQPHHCVSVACEDLIDDGWTAVAGAVLDVGRDELFTAARGSGAFLNDRRIQVNDPVPAALALVATEFSYQAASRSRQAETIRRLLPQVRDLRTTGSSALDLCWTACGRVDAFVEDELERWDFAAGALIATEAAGRVTTLRAGLVASGPALHPWLLEASLG